MHFQVVRRSGDVPFFHSERISSWTRYRVPASHVKDNLLGEMGRVLSRSKCRRRCVGVARKEIRVLIKLEDQRDSLLRVHRHLLPSPGRLWVLGLVFGLTLLDRMLEIVNTWNLWSPPNKRCGSMCSDMLVDRSAPQVSSAGMANSVVEEQRIGFGERNSTN
jgi:hypothetical protein